ncbi:aldehyde dehydrogenase family protein, partial [Pseudomonas sp. KHB2.9]
MAYTTINPYNGELLAQFDTLTAEQLEHKLAAAAQCYATWKHTTYAQRASIIAKAGELMHQRFDALARKITLEMGKRIDEARGEVKFSADIMAYYAKNAERFLAPQALEPNQGEAHMESSPIGVIFGVEPWNFPFYQLARVAGPHLMAGNVLVIKHAGCVPQCAMAFEQILLEAGAPAGLYTNLSISHEQSRQVVDDPR